MIWLTDEERALASKMWKREARERERQQDRIRERLDGILRLLSRDDRAFVRELIERRTGLP